MLEKIAIALVLLWLLGIVCAYTLGGYLHLLLLVAAFIIVIRSVRGNGNNKPAG